MNYEAIEELFMEHHTDISWADQEWDSNNLNCRPGTLLGNCLFDRCEADDGIEALCGDLCPHCE